MLNKYQNISGAIVDQDNNTEKENNIIQSAAFSLSIINDGKTTVTLQIGCKNGR